MVLPRGSVVLPHAQPAALQSQPQENPNLGGDPVGNREEFPPPGLQPWCWAGPGRVEVGSREYPGLPPAPHDFSVPAVRLHDSISEEGFHYLVFDL